EQPHEAGDLLHGTAPVLARESEQSECSHLSARALLDTHAHRIEAGLVARRARKSARRGPASVAIHGDRDMPGHDVGHGAPHQICMTSFSFACSACSMSAMCLSVSFWIST